MIGTILTIISSVLACIIGVFTWKARKDKYRREQAEQAKKDLDNANKNDDPGGILDAFGRLR